MEFLGKIWTTQLQLLDGVLIQLLEPNFGLWETPMGQAGETMEISLLNVVLTNLLLKVKQLLMNQFYVVSLNADYYYLVYLFKP